MDNELKELGFKGFTHIDQKKRDGIKRKAWAGLYKENLILIIIKNLNGCYFLENIIYDFHDQAISDLLNKKNDITSVLQFVKNQCFR